MNYLRSYKVFEYNESGLMDCLVELFDYGFEPELSGLDCRITIQMYQRIVDLLKQHQNLDISKYQIERIKSIRTK